MGWADVSGHGLGGQGGHSGYGFSLHQPQVSLPQLQRSGSQPPAHTGSTWSASAATAAGGNSSSFWQARGTHNSINSNSSTNHNYHNHNHNHTNSHFHNHNSIATPSHGKLPLLLSLEEAAFAAPGAAAQTPAAKRLCDSEEKDRKAQRQVMAALANCRAGIPSRHPARQQTQDVSLHSSMLYDTLHSSSASWLTTGERTTGMSSVALAAARDAARQERLKQLPRPPKYKKVTASDRRNNSQNALNADLERQKQRLVQTAEPPAQREERQKELKGHRWSTIFAPTTRARELLPLRFGGRLPLLNTDRNNTAVSTEKAPVVLTFEEAEALVVICTAFQRLESSMMAENVASTSSPPAVLSRSTFCRLLCAMSGLSTYDGGRTQLTKAAEYFDNMSAKICLSTMSPLANSSAGGGPYVFGLSMAYATVPQSKLPELLDLPLCKLFGRLLLYMMEDVPNLGYGEAEERLYKDGKVKERLFDVLIPRAEAYATERAAHVYRLIRRGGAGGAGMRPVPSSIEETKNVLQKIGEIVETPPKDRSPPRTPGGKAPSPGLRASPPRSASPGEGARRAGRTLTIDDSAQVLNEVAFSKELPVEATITTKVPPSGPAAAALPQSQAQSQPQVQPQASVSATTSMAATSTTPGQGPGAGVGQGLGLVPEEAEGTAAGRGAGPAPGPGAGGGPGGGVGRKPGGGLGLPGDRQGGLQEGLQGGSGLLGGLQGGEGDMSPNPGTAHTFGVIKGEVLQAQLCEPELLHFIAEFSDVFGKIFEAYCDVPVLNSEGHMSLVGFLHVCSDFGLFPAIADYQTVQWVYESAEGWIAMNYLTTEVSASSKQQPSMSRKTIAGGTATSATLRSTKKRKIKGEPGRDGFLFYGKWVSRHLAWLTKDPSEMTEMEQASTCTLWAISEWMDHRKLSVKDLFCFLDKDNSGLITLEEFRTGIDFMEFEDPPSTEAITNLMRLIMPPTPPPSAQAQHGHGKPLAASDEDKPLLVEFNVLSMALGAVGKQREQRDRAAHFFMKDFSQMTRPESKACIFFAGLWAIMQERSLTPDDLFDELDENRDGEVSEDELTRAINRMLQMSNRPLASSSVDSPFELLDTNQDGRISRSEFQGILEKVKQARDLRDLVADSTHPIFLSATVALQPVSRNYVFGLQAFTECLIKLALNHLTYHGNHAQAEQPAFVKGMWMLVYMHDFYLQAQAKADVILQAEKERGETLMSPNFLSDTPGRKYPKCLSPIQRLLRKHPNLFVEAPLGKSPLELPPWMAPGADSGSPPSRPGTRTSSRPASRLGASMERPGTQEALYRSGWGRLAEAAVHRVHTDEEPVDAAGERSLVRLLLSACTTGRCGGES